MLVLGRDMESLKQVSSKYIEAFGMIENFMAKVNWLYLIISMMETFKMACLMEMEPFI